jgi:hypothetical protein
MADHVELDPGTGGAIVATDDVGGNHYQRVKLTDGTVDSSTVINAGGGVEANALRVTVASDSTGVLSVDDNGGSLTVDGSVSLAAAVPAGNNNIGDVDVASIAAGDNNIGNVDIVTVPADPFGVNADAAVAAGAAGSIQAKLRLMTSQLDSIKTAVEILDNTVAGSELQVDVLTAPTTVVTNTQLSVVGSGTEAAAQRVTIATDSTGVLSVDDNGSSLTVDNGGTFAVQVNGAALTALELLDNTIHVDDAATFTPATGSVSMVGFLADQASTDSVNEGDVGAARMTLDRKQIVTVAPSSDSEGWDVANNIDVDETEDAVKTGPGKLGGYYWYNDGASEVYIKYYNDTVANVIVGTTAPFMTIPIPAGAAANVEWTNGIAFSAAITVAATTAAATADTGAPAANQVVGFSLYK